MADLEDVLRALDGGISNVDEKVKVTSTDTTSGNLNDKITVSGSITKTVVDNGSGEKTLQFSVPLDSDVMTKVSSDDTTTGFLEDKMTAGQNTIFSTINPGGDEVLSISSILTDPKNYALSGYVSSGSPSILSAGTDLQVLIEASSTPLILAFGAGWDSGGAVQKIAKVTSDGSVSGLTASDTNYIYADRNISTGIITFVAGLYAIDMRMALNPSPADGMHNYIIPENKLYVRESGAWVEKQRVPIGEVVTGESSVTSCITYAFGLDWIGSKLKGFSKEATDAATIEVNCHQCAQNYVTITSTGRTLNHRNLMPGISYNTAIIQGTGGSKTITTYGFYGTDGNALTVKWQGGAVTTLSIDAEAVDILTILVMGGVAYVGSTTGFSTPA